jgi:2-polyprenyl-6-methoxyphenol hydroxylase-like FAD-dependent oxidoreductase
LKALAGMPPSESGRTDVLIVGAGPTGLVLALWLTRLGVRVSVIDRTAEAGTTSRAVGVQARTLELYGQAGLAETVVRNGRKAAAANLWVTGRKAARAPFGDMGAGMSPYPYVLIYPQDEHERLLIDRLAQAGVAVERRTELVEFEEASNGVRASLRGPDGGISLREAAYIAGCDGAHSVVRQALGIGFGGGTYRHLFYVADAEGSGAAMNGEVHVALDTADFLAVFPLKAEGRARLIGTIREDAEGEGENLSWDDVSKRVIEWTRIDVRRVSAPPSRSDLYTSTAPARSTSPGNSPPSSGEGPPTRSWTRTSRNASPLRAVSSRRRIESSRPSRAPGSSPGGSGSTSSR